MDGERDRERDALNGHSAVVPRIVHQVKSADDKLVTFVRARPLVAVCAALALGYVLGRVFARVG